MAYTYDKQLWKDYPDTSTPITADRLNHMEDGIAEAAKNGGGESDKVGVVKMFSGSTAPEGWLLCDGSAVSRTTYSELFSIIGTTYGTGDGSTTFNIPNIKGRTVVGLNSSDTDFKTLGKTGGEKTHKLTVNEMPSHKHNVSFSTQLGNAEQRLALGSNSGGTTGTTGVYGTPTVDAGGNQPHNNLQPYIVLNYIIKASTTTPVQAEVIDSLDGNSTTNAPSVHAVNDGLKNKIIVDTLFSGVGTKATNLTDFFTTTMTKNPLDYDFVVITFSNNGSQYEEINVIMTPKTDSNGVTVYFAATNLYYVYMRVICSENAIKHRVMDHKAWATSDVYIKSVIGIKIN